MSRNGPATLERVAPPPGFVRTPKPSQERPPISEAKDGANRQRHRIRQIGRALRDAGFVTLDEQAYTIGLPRSTTWTILRADHKISGLHAKVISRMLSCDQLPSAVRLVLCEYVIEKAQGHYGHSLLAEAVFLRAFETCLSLQMPKWFALKFAQTLASAHVSLASSN